MSRQRWFGWLTRETPWVKLATLLITVFAVAALSVDYARLPELEFQAGDVAPRTVRAASTFEVLDHEAREREQESARQAELVVLRKRERVLGRLDQRVVEAFEQGRQALAASQDGLSPAFVNTQVERFVSTLDVSLPGDAVVPLLQDGFSNASEQVTRQLLAKGMEGVVLPNREGLPAERAPLRLLTTTTNGEEVEDVLIDWELLGTPATRREAVQQLRLDLPSADAAWMDAAERVARALLRPNAFVDEDETERRREAAASRVPPVVVTIKGGTTLFRDGDPLTEQDLARYEALRSLHGGGSLLLDLTSIAAFLAFMSLALVQFGATQLRGFTTTSRDLQAMGFLLVLVALMGRLVVAGSDPVSVAIGGVLEPRYLWYLVPAAGAVMLARLLVSVAWASVFAVASAAVLGLVMDIEAVYILYYLITGIAAVGAVEHTRERMALLRAGVSIGAVGAAAVLVLHMVELTATGESLLTSLLGPLWSMAFAFLGGLLSGILVLGMVPLFEAVGFVTDFRLLELANLNHPLLRQLMLRAPGTYHHSVIVGSLAEAAAEAIGANALQARVACYFHDIGKTLKPDYFVENQSGQNKHDRLEPHASARILINHVVDGSRMAREHGLPQPIIDNIHMHHGTGIIQYFYARALEQAGEDGEVDERDFRYPGPKPNSREAGIVMLADKVEAATRTIKEPTPENLSAMISKIINSVMADDQFSECPLTFREIYTIADTFVSVLTGIYHHRIEYPDTTKEHSSRRRKKDGEQGQGSQRGVPASAVITLELPARPTDPPEEEPSMGEVDYESVRHLPGNEGT